MSLQARYLLCEAFPLERHGPAFLSIQPFYLSIIAMREHGVPVYSCHLGLTVFCLSSRTQSGGNGSTTSISNEGEREIQFFEVGSVPISSGRSEGFSMFRRIIRISVGDIQVVDLLHIPTGFLYTAPTEAQSATLTHTSSACWCLIGTTSAWHTCCTRGRCATGTNRCRRRGVKPLFGP